MSGEYEYGSATEQLESLISHITSTIEDFGKNNQNDNLTVTIQVLKGYLENVQEILRAIKAGKV